MNSSSRLFCNLQKYQPTKKMKMFLKHYSLIIGEGNDNPLQYSCLENSRDRGAW